MENVLGAANSGNKYYQVDSSPEGYQDEWGPRFLRLFVH